MYKFSELIKSSKITSESIRLKLAVLGDCATQHLSMTIKGFGNLENFPMEIYDADYNQIELQAFDENSELYMFKPDAVLLLMCRQKLFEKYCEYDNKELFAESVMNEISSIQEKIFHYSKASIIQFTFENDNDMVFGNLGLKIKKSFAYQINRLNMLLMEYAAEHKYCYLIDINRIKNNIFPDKFTEEKLYCNAKMTISPAALPETAANVVSILKAMKGYTKKCIILDLDNTLWGGIIGDDGMDNIELGELGIGHAFTKLQMWLKELKERGIILCVCSKNNEDTAKEPFEKHPDMILRLDDIAMFVANWEDKASNIRYIQQTLNIGMDSIVFLDDNAFERNLVRDMIKEITVPELPEDPAEYCAYLKSLNLFETVSFSENDSERTQQYKAEIDRTKLMTSFSDFNDYLKSLEMQGTAKPFDPYFYPRIAQLTQRSNQFNLRTVRYTESDIERISGDKNYISLYFTLKDKFGDHGLVSVVILKKNGESAFIDTWLMSCRVLKRGMEEYVINSVFRTAADSGIKTIEGEYIPTPKNAMVKDIYSKFGFTQTSENHYEMSVSNYSPKESFIN